MTIIFKTKTCQIKKNKHKYELIYEDGEKFNKFFEKTKKNLKIIKEKKNKSFTFEAYSVESLKTYSNDINYLQYVTVRNSM